MPSYGIQKYSYYASRLAKSCADGFRLADNAFETTEDDLQYRVLFLGALDSGQQDCSWGRLTFQYEMEGDLVLTLHACASNESEIQDGGSILTVDEFLLSQEQPVRRKARLFEALGGARFSNAGDVLLYGQTGQRLWLWF